MVVVVPARDEAATIVACLGSLLVAIDACPVPVHLVVVDDASRDGTATLARHVLGRDHLVVEGPARDVGAARRAGVDAAAAWVTDPTTTWLASTDADTTVPPDWLRRHFDHARAGADAVAGVVQLASGASPALRSAWLDHYGTAVSGPHPHVHAANLGIRWSTLVAAGSWRAASHAEEHDLWGRLPATARVVADAALTVSTSPRRRGRAPIGLAADLARLASRLVPADDVRPASA